MPEDFSRRTIQRILTRPNFFPAFDHRLSSRAMEPPQGQHLAIVYPLFAFMTMGANDAAYGVRLVLPIGPKVYNVFLIYYLNILIIILV